MADSGPETTAGQPSGLFNELSRRVLDNLLEGCQVIDREYRYLYVNDALARHGRSTRDLMMGRTMMDVYPGIEHTEMFALLRRCMQDGIPARFENQFTFPDGSGGWFELHFEPVPEGVTILSVDITEHKVLESALRRSLRAVRTLSRCNHTLVRATDEHEFMTEVCNLVVEVGGYPMAWIARSDQEAGRHIRLVAQAGLEHDGADSAGVPLLDLDSHRLPASVAMRTGTSIVALLAAIDPADDPAAKLAVQRGLVSCIALPIFGHDACIGALTIYAKEPESFDDAERELLDEVAMDLGYGITTLRARIARAQTVAKLEEAKAKTRAIYDRLPHATFVWRLQTEGFRLVDFNEAARVATRGGVVDLMDSPPSELGAEIPYIENDLHCCFERRMPLRREAQCLLRGADHPRRLVLTYGFIPPDMVLMHGEDVTAQRRTEEQFLAAQRLEAVGRLAGGVAHDFNNLLSVILSYTDFALGELEASSPVRADIEEVRGAGERAAALTRQLLAFSRKQVLEPEVSSLNEVVRGIESMLRRLLEEDIDIEVHLADELGSVMADPGQLEQVIMNLAVNARDAMPHGGKLTVETSNVDLDVEYIEGDSAVGAGPHVMLAMSDTGSGMDAETRSRIFEPFFTTKDQGKGTGLGLSTVYGIIKQSGGSVWVDSELGHGTTFKIYLPRVDAPARGRRLRTSPTALRGSETILVVEDEEAVRRVAARILSTAGYHVLTATSGPEALSIGEDHSGKIDLLLTDVVMPQMSGRELAVKMAERNPGVTVLFTSGYAHAVAADPGVSNASARFIAKPFSAAELSRRVREALDEARSGHEP